jgi:hypothetical protein
MEGDVMRRVTAVLMLVGSLVLGLTVVAGGARAQDATPPAGSVPMAGHPVVGTWIVTDPQGSPSVTSFTADGVVTDVEADGGGALGAWEPTGADTVAFTMILVVSSPEFTATVQINGTLTIDASGDTGSGDYSYTAVLPNGTVAESGTGTVTIARMPIQPLDAAGTPIASFPAWNPNAGEGTPEATPES